MPRSSRTGLLRRTGWLWSVAPPDVRHVVVEDDPEAASAFAATGWPVAEHRTAHAPSVRVATYTAMSAAAPPSSAPGELLVVLPDERVTWRTRRAWTAAAPRTGEVRHLLTVGGRRAGHRLGARLGAPVLVIGREQPSALTAAQAAAEARLAVPLRRGIVRALAGQTLMAEMVPPDGSRLLLRLASGRPAQSLLHASAVQRALAAGPAAQGNRIVAPVADGAVGEVRWTLEPFAAGRAPRTLTTRCTQDAIDFLARLHLTPSDAPVVPPWSTGADRLDERLPAASVRLLGEIRERVASRLADVRRGWVHGDFWLANLLVTRGRLTTVLDWDGARSDGLPLLDLLHLVSYGSVRLRRLPLGSRCVDHLWPLARAGGDSVIRDYCRRVDLSPSPQTLEPLALAYWLGRIDRDVALFPGRLDDVSWMRRNVHAPLHHLTSRPTGS